MSYLNNLDEIKKSEQDKLAQEKNNKKAEFNTIYDNEKKVLNDEYSFAIDGANSAYADLYNKNAVQKLINEHQVAESMANLGLTDSGINRTQQSGVQLSYANQKSKIDSQRQKTLDELSVKLASQVADIENKRIEALGDIDDYYEKLAYSRALDVYKSLK